MPPETVPDDLRRFILTSVPSVPFLEALLLLRTGEREWPLPEVAQRLYLSEPATAQALERLCEAGMAVRGTSGLYRFRPGTEELRGMVDRLAVHYARDLVGVTALIHSQLGKSAQVFADAFKWRKDS